MYLRAYLTGAALGGQVISRHEPATVIYAQLWFTRRSLHFYNARQLLKYTLSSRMKYFEDYPVGAVFEFPPFTTNEAEIIEFAKRFDAQPFHVDPVAAKQSHFGGIIASGFHTCSMAMGSLVTHGFFSTAGMGSPGLDEIRWRQPVRANQQLRVRTTILEATLSKSKPDRGVIRHIVELLNENNETVMSYIAKSMFPTRRSARQLSA
jgi:acyl dehydratase